MRSLILFAATSLVACSADSFEVAGTPDAAGIDTAVADTTTPPVKDSSVTDSAHPEDTSKPDTAKDSGLPDPVDTGRPEVSAGQCVTNTDCKKFSSYCPDEPCVCKPLRSTDPTPICMGPMVACLVDPCNGKTVECSAGVCVIKS